MGWGRYLLLGDLGQQLDLQDRQREMEAMRRDVESQWTRDSNQDQRISSLEAENRDLKLYFASLVKLLGSKGTITPAEVAEMVRLVDGDAPAGR